MRASVSLSLQQRSVDHSAMSFCSCNRAAVRRPAWSWNKALDAERAGPPPKSGVTPQLGGLIKRLEVTAVT